MKSFESTVVGGFVEHTSTSHIPEGFVVSRGECENDTWYSVVPTTRYDHLAKELVVRRHEAASSSLPVDSNIEPVHEIKATTPGDPRALAMLGFTAFIGIAVENYMSHAESSVFALVSSEDADFYAGQERKLYETALDMKPASKTIVVYDNDPTSDSYTTSQVYGDDTPLKTLQGEIIMLGGAAREIAGSAQAVIDQYNLNQSPM